MLFSIEDFMKKQSFLKGRYCLSRHKEELKQVQYNRVSLVKILAQRIDRLKPAILPNRIEKQSDLSNQISPH